MGIAGYKGSDQRKEKKGGSLDKIIIVSEKSYGIILLTLYVKKAYNNMHNSVYEYILNCQTIKKNKMKIWE